MLYLTSLLSFLLPTQLALHFNFSQSTVYGFQIDYLIPTLYLTDIIVIAIVAMWLYGNKFKFSRKFLVFSLLYLAFVVLNLFVSSYPIPAIYKWLKITEMIVLGLIIFNTKKFDIFTNFIKPLSYSIFIACVLGIFQFINKGSIGGIFYWFGERSFLFNDPNVAPYPYSFFSHPNSFAGFLLVFGIFAVQHKDKFNPKYFWTLFILVITNLVLTSSLNVYITTGVLLLLSLRKNLAFSFLTFDFSERFITHRLELIEASWQMIKSNFWLGVGLNNFIPNLVKVSNKFVNSWELQPVHNIFLLVFSETGIIGLLVFGYLLLTGLTTNSLPLIAVLTSGFSDHYWLTLQQNMLLFTYVLVISKQSLLLQRKKHAKK